MWYTVFDPEWEKYGALQQVVEKAEDCRKYSEHLKNEGIVQAYLGEKAALLITSTGERVLVGKDSCYFAQVCFLKKYGYLLECTELVENIKRILQ